MVMVKYYCPSDDIVSVKHKLELIPGDPSRDAIEASDGLDGRDRLGSGGIFRHKKGGHGGPPVRG